MSDTKTHFVRQGMMNTVCGFGFRPWRAWSVAGHAPDPGVTCEKCRDGLVGATERAGQGVPGIIQLGRPNAWNGPGNKIAVREEQGPIE